MLIAAPNIQICASYVLTGIDAISAPNGGSARVLSNLLRLSVTVAAPVAPGWFWSPRRCAAGPALAW
jgi:hypothetical protein